MPRWPSPNAGANDESHGLRPFVTHPITFPRQLEASERHIGVSRSRALVHVGPNKCGSTTLQQYLAKHTALLERDKYRTFRFFSEKSLCYGCKSFSAVADALIKQRRNGRPQGVAWTIFQRLINNTLSDGSSLILSAEDLDNPKVNTTSLALALHRFDTRIIIVYRPYIEWLASLHAELFHNDRAFKKSRVNQTIGNHSRALKDHIPFLEWLSPSTIREEATVGRFTSAVAHRYARHWRGSITILNLGTGSLLSDLLCGPDAVATHTCQSLRTKATAQLPLNQRRFGETLFLQDLVAAAHARELLPPQLKLRVVLEEMRATVAAMESNRTLPYKWRCLRRSQIALLHNVSVEAKERLAALVPTWQPLRSEEEREMSLLTATTTRRGILPPLPPYRNAGMCGADVSRLLSYAPFLSCLRARLSARTP